MPALILGIAFWVGAARMLLAPGNTVPEYPIVAPATIAFVELGS